MDAAPGKDRNQNVFINDENYHSRPSQNDTGVITGLYLDDCEHLRRTLVNLYLGEIPSCITDLEKSSES